jgi:hypothetical protein
LKKQNDDIMACCCVWQIVEMNRPTPSVVSKEKTVESRSSGDLPPAPLGAHPADPPNPAACGSAAR